jgi:iron complex transport system ATP-binding protein
MGLLQWLAREERLAIVVSTHDLELALRMADTVWVISSDQHIHSGAPEDMILEGRIQAAFPAQTLHFVPKDRTFRPVIRPRGNASVCGDGLAAVLAEAVLEREGFEVITGAPGSLTVTVTGEGTSWEVVTPVTRGSGQGFAALARFVREAPNKIGR